jgi:hypothetical protein
MTMNNWTVKDIDIDYGNAAPPSGEPPKDEPTAYHAPRLNRTLKGGPGNRSSINACSCGGRFDGVYAHVGHERRMCDWYAQHAGIVGGGAAVQMALRQYDEALDAVSYPDHPGTCGKIAVSPREIIDGLRKER